MSSKLIPVITNIGLEAIKTSKVSITHVAIGLYNITDPAGSSPSASCTELKDEAFRKKIETATIDDKNNIHIEILLDKNQEKGADNIENNDYSITEIGFILNTGELFAIFAHEKGIIAFKRKNYELYLTLELSIFRNLRTGKISDFSESIINKNRQTVCKSKNHKLIEGDIIKITDHYKYNGNYQICNATADCFNINKKFIQTDQLKALWSKEYEVSYKIDKSVNGTSLREILFQGVNLITISTQKEFDHIFNQGCNTKIPANSTIVLSPIQGNVDKNGEDTFNGRSGYLLKNTILLASNISIRGFNTSNTIIVKHLPNINFRLIGSKFEPIKGVELEGWSFDGRGGINDLGGKFISNIDGGAFYLSNAEDCTLNCQIINHMTTAKGGGIFGTLDCRNITAENISWNRDIYGNDVYGCFESIFKGSNCKIRSNKSILFNYDLAKIQIVDHDLSNQRFQNRKNGKINLHRKQDYFFTAFSDILPWATIDQKGIIKLATMKDIEEGTSNELGISVELLKKVFYNIRNTISPIRKKALPNTKEIK